MNPNPQATALPKGAGADYFNAEHYPDPTAWAAMRLVQTRQEKKQLYDARIKELERYRYSVQQVNSLADQLVELRAMACRVTPVLSLSPRSPGTVPNRLPKAVERIQQVQKQLEQEIEHCMKIQTQVLQLLDTVEDEKERTILRMHYLNGRTLEQIAQKLNHDPRWTRRLHHKAVEKLNIPDLPVPASKR